MKKYVVVVELEGCIEHCENNIDLIISSIDATQMCKVSIEVQNHGEVEY